MDATKGYISPKNIAEYLDYEITTVQKWCKQKKLKAQKIGKDWRILKADFEEWKKRNIVEI